MRIEKKILIHFDSGGTSYSVSPAILLEAIERVEQFVTPTTQPERSLDQQALKMLCVLARDLQNNSLNT